MLHLNQIHLKKATVPAPSPHRKPGHSRRGRPSLASIVPNVHRQQHTYLPYLGGNLATHTQSHQGSQVPPHTKDQSGRSWAHRKLLDLISFPFGWLGGGGGADKGSNRSGTKWAHGHVAAAAELCVLHSRAEMLHQVTLQKGRDQEATESPPPNAMASCQEQRTSS